MPYIDDGGSVDGPTKGFFTIGGDIDANSTNGLISEENRFTCSNCGNRVHEDDYAQDDMCRECWDENYTSCYRCSDSVSIEDANTYDGDSYCGHCYERYVAECHNCSDTFLRAHGTVAGDETYCEDCASDIHACAVCEDDFYSTSGDEVCDTCERTHKHCTECDTWYEPTEKPQAPNRVEFPGTDTVSDGIYPADLVIAEPSYHAYCSECARQIKADGLQTFDWTDTTQTEDAKETNTANRYHLELRTAPLPAGTFPLQFCKIATRYYRSNRELMTRDFYAQQWTISDTPLEVTQETRTALNAMLGISTVDVYRVTPYSTYLGVYDFRRRHWRTDYETFCIDDRYVSLADVPRRETATTNVLGVSL